MTNNKEVEESLKILEILSEFINADSESYIKSEPIRNAMGKAFIDIYDNIRIEYENYIENLFFIGEIYYELATGEITTQNPFKE